jgi:hypothetical protein
MLKCLTSAPVDTIATCTACTESTRASACTTTTVLWFGAPRRCGTTVASDSAVPARVAPGTAVESIATAACELAGVATVTSSGAGTRRPIKTESVAAQQACVGMFCCAIRK